MAQLQLEGSSGATDTVKKKKGIGKVIFIILIIVLIVIIVSLVKPAKAKGSNIPTNNLSPTPTGGGTVQPSTQSTNRPSTSTTPIRQTPTNSTGCQSNWTYKDGKGGYVESLQQFLNARMGAGLAVDGIYGPKTDTASANYMRQFSKNGEQLACDVWAWKSGATSPTSSVRTSTVSSGYTSEKARQDALKIWQETQKVKLYVSDSTIIGVLFGKSKADVDLIKYHYNNDLYMGKGNRNMITDLKAKMSADQYNKIATIL